MLETSLKELGGGRRVRVARLGTGEPLILLHGYPDNLQIWCELAVRLAKNFQVIAFDWPGMGFSDEWPGGTTPMHMADRLLALMDAWKLERAHIAGMDMGGQPALVFAARNPARVMRTVVMNSLVMWNEQTSWEITLLRKFGFNRFALRHFPGTIFRRAERTFVPAGMMLPADLRADMWESFNAKPVRKFIIRMCAGYQGTLPSLPKMYPVITTPLLVLWGANDKHFPLAHAEQLHRLVPGSSLQIVPGGEHWMAWYLAEEIAQRFRQFLAGVR